MNTGSSGNTPNGSIPEKSDSTLFGDGADFLFVIPEKSWLAEHDGKTLKFAIKVSKHLPEESSGYLMDTSKVKDMTKPIFRGAIWPPTK